MEHYGNEGERGRAADTAAASGGGPDNSHVAKIFALYDRDANGYIDFAEMQDIIEHLHIELAGPHQEAARDILEAADVNGNKWLDPREFTQQLGVREKVCVCVCVCELGGSFIER